MTRRRPARRDRVLVPPGRMRAALVAAGLAAALLPGCGAAQVSPDLFLVERTTAGSPAKLTVVVSEEGGLRCDMGRALMLSDPQIIEARTIAEELQEKLHGPISRHATLAAAPGSVYAYRVRNGEGSLGFADNSPHQPKVLRKLQLFVTQVADGVCHQH